MLSTVAKYNLRDYRNSYLGIYRVANSEAADNLKATTSHIFIFLQ